jgi:type III secretory pathway lipoprotein EscJ
MKHVPALALALVALGACSDAPERETLIEVASELEANKLVCALDLCRIEDAAKVLERRDDKPLWRVTVPEGQLARAERVRQAFGLPQLDSPLDTSVTADDGAWTIESSAAERQRAQWREAMRLEQSLRSEPEIFGARVHLALPTVGLSGERLKGSVPSASVLVRYAELPGMEPGVPPITVERIQALVAGAVEGLEPARVAVHVSVIRPDAVLNPAGASTEALPSDDSVSRVAASVEPWITGGLALISAALFLALWSRRRRVAVQSPVAKDALQA